MRINKLTDPYLFIKTLEDKLVLYDMGVYTVKFHNPTDVSFQVRRLSNKPYSLGGVKYGKSVMGFLDKSQFHLSTFLHEEELYLLYDTINNICDAKDLDGSCRVFDITEGYIWIRRNGVTNWYSKLKEYEVKELSIGV